MNTDRIDYVKKLKRKICVYLCNLCPISRGFMFRQRLSLIMVTMIGVVLAVHFSGATRAAPAVGAPGKNDTGPITATAVGLTINVTMKYF
jgi:hypothetical protein